MQLGSGSILGFTDCSGKWWYKIHRNGTQMKVTEIVRLSPQ